MLSQQTSSNPDNDDAATSRARRISGVPCVVAGRFPLDVLDPFGWLRAK